MTLKYYKHLESLPKEFISTINTVIETILDTYNVTTKDTCEPVCDPKTLLKQLGLDRPSETSCRAITASGNMCVWKAMSGEQYCKRHISSKFKWGTNRGSDNVSASDHVSNDNVSASDTVSDHASNASNTDEVSDHASNEVGKVSASDLVKRFIEDSFYYTDHKFVYSMDSMDIVGYKHKSEWVLTNNALELKLVM